LATPHCPTCGEQAPHPKDLTLVGLLHHLFHTLTSVDSRLLRSLRALTTRPGVLTNAYLRGPRKPFIGPFELFLIVNVVFFAVQSFSGWPIFSTTLDAHLHGQDWSSLAQSLVDQKLRVTHTALSAYTPIFDHAVEINAKSLVILMVLPFALLLIPLFHGSGRPFVTHLVFALHFYAFLLLCFCVLLLFTFVETLSGGSGLRSTALDGARLGIVRCLTGRRRRLPVCRNGIGLRRRGHRSCRQAGTAGCRDSSGSTGLSIPDFPDHALCYVTRSATFAAT
jgi:hypothetical protein